MEGIDPGKGTSRCKLKKTVTFVQISYSPFMMDVHVLNNQTRIYILFRVELSTVLLFCQIFTTMWVDCVACTILLF